MKSKSGFSGNPFDPLGYVVLVGFTGQRPMSLNGPLCQISPGIWGGGGMMFNSRGVQVNARGEIVRPPQVMAINEPDPTLAINEKM